MEETPRHRHYVNGSIMRPLRIASRYPTHAMHSGDVRLEGHHAIHIALVARGPNGRLLNSLITMANAANWAAAPSRLRFTVLAGEAALHHGGHSDATLAKLVEEQALQGSAALRNATISIANASDAALLEAFSPDAAAVFAHPALQGKNVLFTAPKLYLHELLAAPAALLIDTDMLVLADVAGAIAYRVSGGHACARGLTSTRPCHPCPHCHSPRLAQSCGTRHTPKRAGGPR